MKKKTRCFFYGIALKFFGIIFVEKFFILGKSVSSCNLIRSSKRPEPSSVVSLPSARIANFPWPRRLLASAAAATLRHLRHLRILILDVSFAAEVVSSTDVPPSLSWWFLFASSSRFVSFFFPFLWWHWTTCTSHYDSWLFLSGSKVQNLSFGLFRWRFSAASCTVKFQISKFILLFIKFIWKSYPCLCLRLEHRLLIFLFRCPQLRWAEVSISLFYLSISDCISLFLFHEISIPSVMIQLSVSLWQKIWIHRAMHSSVERLSLGEINLKEGLVSDLSILLCYVLLGNSCIMLSVLVFLWSNRGNWSRA